MAATDQAQHPVILFDGVCNLCSSVVQFVIKRDPKSAFRFASLQSNFGQALLQQFGLAHDNFSSFVLYKNGKIYTRSTGALLVAKQLSGFWPLVAALIIIPRFLRDAVYHFVANNRYRWFGKKETCFVPDPSIKINFFD